MVPVVKFEKKPKVKKSQLQPPPLPEGALVESLVADNRRLRLELKLMEDRAVLATFFLSLLAEHSRVAHVGLRLVQKVAR